MKTLVSKSRLVSCRQPGCDHAPFKTKQGENLHFHRTHSGRVRVKGQKAAKTPAPTNGHAAPIDLGSDRPEAVQPAANKRQYTKRHYTKRQNALTSVEVLFCPQCGTDLKAVAIGFILKGVKVNVGFCPCCGLNTHNVAMGMAVGNLSQKKYGKAKKN